MSSGLEARELVVRLGAAPVLAGVTLEARPGEIVGVFGASGAGKSTLFAALAGEIPARGGAVLLEGEDVTRLPLFRRAERGLGYLPQGPSVLWDLDVESNLESFLRLARRPAGRLVAGESFAAAAGRGGAGARALSELFGLEGRLGVRARDLSGGERRRLELARALASRPSVLVCDEPFAAGDPAGVARMVRVLREHAGAGGAVLLCDHRLDVARPICDRAARLEGGAIAAWGGASPSSERSGPSGPVTDERSEAPRKGRAAGRRASTSGA